jgi:hypothetical protein
VTAESSGRPAHALIACVAQPLPALAFRFTGELGVPRDDAPRGPAVLTTQADWEGFWRRTMRTLPDDGVPPVDFKRFSVVALVDDRATYHETPPVITHVSDNRSRVHVVFPGVEATGVSYHRATFLFLTGPLRPEATMQVQTLCAPE